MKSIGFYEKYSDTGNHKYYLKKVGDINSVSNDVFRVTYISGNSATVTYNNEIHPLKEGTIIGANTIIKTNFSKIEICSQNNETYRLNENSEFCIENTIEGLKPVYYGNVYYKCNKLNITNGSGKYRTSCWFDVTTSLLIERINHYSDIYYTLDEPLEIYEYDESGIKFSIVKIEPFQKCTLKFDFKKNMRNRYKVIEIENINQEEIEYIYNNYVSPINWNKNYKAKENKSLINILKSEIS